MPPALIARVARVTHPTNRLKSYEPVSEPCGNLFGQQAYLDDLAPWISPGDLPLLVRQPFTPLDQVTCTPHDDEDIAVALSPQGAAVLRAWLRQRGADPLVCRS